MARFHSSSLPCDTPLYIYIHHIFLIHSSVDRHLGFFHDLAIVDSAAMNIGVHVPLCISISVSLGEIASSAITGS
uniref:Uncharacterized protein n=1 Tax=Suricata suricatta TaxID=37032 RepID=A0A673UB29_SURSU